VISPAVFSCCGNVTLTVVLGCMTAINERKVVGKPERICPTLLLQVEELISLVSLDIFYLPMSLIWTNDSYSIHGTSV